MEMRKGKGKKKCEGRRAAIGICEVWTVLNKTQKSRKMGERRIRNGVKKEKRLLRTRCHIVPAAHIHKKKKGKTQNNFPSTSYCPENTL